MGRLRLHLDADTSNKALYQALIARDHDVTRTPTTWIAFDASDEQQLLSATAQGRCLFTFNIRDFMILTSQFPHHAGIILAAQQRWSLAQMIEALHRILSETAAEDWTGQVRWLNAWRS